MRFLVVGATGMLGEPVARQLLSDGHELRLLVRNADKARARFGDDVEIVAGDVTRPETLPPAMAGCEAVHVNLSGGTSLDDMVRNEQHGAANLAAAAKSAGVRRIGYVSGAGLGGASRDIRLVQIKQAAAQAIMNSGIEWMLLAPTHFMESLPQFIHGGRATIIGKQPHRYHYIAASDYAQMVSKAFALPDAANKKLVMFGPEAFTMEEALTRYCAAVHPGMKVVGMPIIAARLLGAITGNAGLRFAADLFSAFQRIGEGGDPTEARRLLGEATTTLDQWCEQQKAKIAA